MPNAGIGVGDGGGGGRGTGTGDGTQEVALGCDSARRAALNICPFCCACLS